MSGKLGSEESDASRDPDTPDPLREQLIAARERRRMMRELKSEQTPELTTPAADPGTGMVKAQLPQGKHASDEVSHDRARASVEI